MMDVEMDDGTTNGSGAKTEASSPTVEQVREALRVVVDPEIGLPIVDLGLVYDIEVGPDGDVKVVYTLTSMGCPVGPLIDHEVRAVLGAMPGVRNVDLEMVFRPPWGPEMMSDEAKAALGYL
jgi:metal-sulfur cluster biosynthetic enzyme